MKKKDRVIAVVILSICCCILLFAVISCGLHSFWGNTLIWILFLFIGLLLYAIGILARDTTESTTQFGQEYIDSAISTLNSTSVNNIYQKRHLIWNILSFMIPLICIYILVSKILLFSVVQSDSMEPKFKVGSTVVFNRLAYKNRTPERGDIVIFWQAESGKYLTKRVIGLPGDQISFSDGYVVINGQYCNELAYLQKDIETNCSKQFSVPADSYFLLGDNRLHSIDSRYWINPYVSIENICGEYMGNFDFSFEYYIINPLKAMRSKSDT